MKWLLLAAGLLAPPADPRQLDAFAMFSMDGGCTGIVNCLDGYASRQNKLAWFPVHLPSLGVPADARVVFLQATLNVTHPAADASVCYLQAMVVGDTYGVTTRSDRQWVYRLMSHRDSERSAQMTVVHPREGYVYVRYHYRGTGQHPEYCSYGLRISVAGWL